jgi:Methylamine utilisation protein MauE
MPPKRWMYYVSAVVLIAFSTVTLSRIMSSGADASCGCLGQALDISLFWSLMLNGALLALVGFGLLANRNGDE